MLRIRLSRRGAKKRPFYRVVVADSRNRPQGRVIDTLGYYDPMKTPKTLDVDLARWDEWVAKGAQASATVHRLVRQQRARETAEHQATA